MMTFSICVEKHAAPSASHNAALETAGGGGSVFRVNRYASEKRLFLHPIRMENGSEHPTSTGNCQFDSRLMVAISCRKDKMLKQVHDRAWAEASGSVRRIGPVVTG